MLCPTSTGAPRIPASAATAITSARPDLARILLAPAAVAVAAQVERDHVVLAA